MPEKPFRLIGPFGNRMVTALDVDAHVPGQVSPETAATLLRTGWRRYTGPATENNGWVVPGSDPSIHPKRVQIS